MKRASITVWSRIGADEKENSFFADALLPSFEVVCPPCRHRVRSMSMSHVNGGDFRKHGDEDLTGVSVHDRQVILVSLDKSVVYGVNVG